MTKTEQTSRVVVANISLSLDGRVSGPGGDYDMSWIVPHAVTAEARAHMVRVTEPATTALLGRKNYQGFGGYWPSVADDPAAAPEDKTFSRWLNEVEKVVFSTTLTQVEWKNAHLATTDPATTVKQLRQLEGGDIIVLASSSIIRALLEADEIDRLSITLCPEVVGGGAHLFSDLPAGTSWTLTSATPTASGASCLIYDRNRH